MPARADPGVALRGHGVAVVIPAYQAAATIAAVVTRTRRAVPDAAVYVVDDGSSDATGELAHAAGATVLVHPCNAGKGRALGAGIARALDGGAEILVTVDADGQHPPEDIPRLAAPVRVGEADLVLGARARRGAMPLGRRLSNWLSAVLASRIAGVRVPDAQTGFRALSRQAAQRVQPRESRYDFETAFLLDALAGGWRVRSVAVPTVYAGQKSHFRAWGDTWRLARVFTRFARAIIFGAR